MRPQTVTLTDASGGAKYSNPIIMDYYNRPETSLQVVVSGTANWTVQQTLNNPLDATQTITWFDHPDPDMVAETGNQQGNYAYVPVAVRLVLNSGDGSATLTVVQAGIYG